MGGFAEEVVLHDTQLMVQLLLLSHVVEIEAATDADGQQDEEQDVAPHALPEGRFNNDREFGDVLAPHSVGVGGFYLEDILAV